MTKYSIFQEKLYSSEVGVYFSFGVAAYDENGNQLAKVSDVFLNRRDAEYFVDLCNNLDLDIIHLNDVIEDALC